MRGQTNRGQTKTRGQTNRGQTKTRGKTKRVVKKNALSIKNRGLTAPGWIYTPPRYLSRTVA
jgi:hypothetical protein